MRLCGDRRLDGDFSSADIISKVSHYSDQIKRQARDMEAQSRKLLSQVQRPQNRCCAFPHSTGLPISTFNRTAYNERCRGCRSSSSPLGLQQQHLSQLGIPMDSRRVPEGFLTDSRQLTDGKVGPLDQVLKRTKSMKYCNCRAMLIAEVLSEIQSPIG